MHTFLKAIGFSKKTSQADIDNLIGEVVDRAESNKVIQKSNGCKFVEYSKELCNHACVVFFTKSEPSRNELRLVEILCEQIDNIKVFSVPPYTRDDLCHMVARNLKNRDIEIKNERLFYEGVLAMIENSETETAKDASELAEQLIMSHVDYSAFTPVIDGKEIKALAKTLNANERRDAV